MSELEGELERRALTYTQWNLSATGNQNWHPFTFNYANAGPQQIKEIKVIILTFLAFTLAKMDIEVNIVIYNR